MLRAAINVPRPLINDLCVFLFQKIDAECVKWASRAGTSVYVKAFIVNVNKCLKPLAWTRTQWDLNNMSRFKAFGLSVVGQAYLELKNADRSTLRQNGCAFVCCAHILRDFKTHHFTFSVSSTWLIWGCILYHFWSSCKMDHDLPLFQFAHAVHSDVIST